MIMLEENYRSTQKILTVANTLIKNNANRFEKKLFTRKNSGADIKTFVGKDGIEEAHWVCRQIADLQKTDPEFKFGDVTVLYRSNYLTKKIEEALIHHDIKYKI